MRRMKPILILLLLLASFVPRALWAADPSLADLKVMADSIWVIVAGMMVFFMNTGFAMLESGLCQSKNAANILAKNFIVFAVASISFWVIGWGLMFGNGSPYFGSEGLFMLSGADNSPEVDNAYVGAYSAIAWTSVPLYVKFFFQLVFAATAATIVSGVVAERIKFISFIVFSFLLVALLYPVTGHWVWGSGWLMTEGFKEAIGANFADFAGSTVVHSVGGWAALAGCILLGPRRGKYGKDGKINPIQGHSLTLATLGALVLWLGWFGFNPGSTMTADGAAIGHIAVVTNAAAAAGILSATAIAWIVLGKPELSMILNGCLAGLVAITAGCDAVSVGSALIIGAVAGVLVVFSIIMFDKLKLDDPVGALSVHLVNGIWGTLAVGIFASEGGLFFGGGASKLLAQLIGILAIGAFTFVGSFIFWGIIKAVLGIRVNEEEELEGLDKGEHGNSAYPDFVLTTPHGHGR